MKLLYKLDSNKKIRVFGITTEGPTIIQEAGVLHGKLFQQKKICKGKNIGKKNETTPSEQAISEMESRINKKRDEGYWDTIDEAENNPTVLPMLAKDYDNEKHKISWVSENTYVQPKLDGMRCFIRVFKDGVRLISRKNKLIDTMPHIENYLNSLNLPIGTILDGELYVHGETFQEQMKRIKKYTKNYSDTICFHIYDIVSEEGFQYRLKWIQTRFSILDNSISSPIRYVPTYPISSEEKLKEYHKKFLRDGYEGSIVRTGYYPYELDKHSDSLLKYKDFKDLALPIIDIVPAEQRPEWGIPVFEYKEKTFNAGVKGTHGYRKFMLKNKEDFIGKTAELRFFEYSEDGIPRFPVMVGLRLDK